MGIWFGYGDHFYRSVGSELYRAVSSAGERKEFTPDEWLQIQDFDASMDSRLDARFPDIVAACEAWEKEED